MPMTLMSMATPMSVVEETAHALGLRVLRVLAGGLFGAWLVTDDRGTPLILKVLPDPSLATTWSTGAAMAERLRANGYPAPVYRGTGSTDGAVWSLQEQMPGVVPDRLHLGTAEQLVALARRHAAD